MLKRAILLLFLLAPFKLYPFWPFFYEFGEEKRILGPLISFSEEDRNELIIRPLFFIHEKKDGVLRFPYPIGRFGPQKSYFIPIYMSHEKDEGRNYSFFLFFWGEENGETYGGFFPFYGKLKNRFGKDRIGFFLWPLYGVSEIGERKKESIVWPIFSLYSGGERGYKVFPLYGVREIEGVKRSQFFLWPFLYMDEKGLDTEDPMRSFYLLPFYISGENKSGSLSSYCVLFPLYCRFKNPERVKVSYLWPFITRSEGKEEGVSVFPLFKRMEKEDYLEEGFIWPFLYTKRESLKEEKEVDVRFLMVNRYEKKEEELYFNIWPLFGYEAKNGVRKLSLPFVFPFRFEGFQKIINPLFSIFEYRREGEWEGLNLLYGLFTHEKRAKSSKTRFAFLFELERKDEETDFRFFSGLISFQQRPNR